MGTPASIILSQGVPTQSMTPYELRGGALALSGEAQNQEHNAQVIIGLKQGNAARAKELLEQEAVSKAYQTIETRNAAQQAPVGQPSPQQPQVIAPQPGTILASTQGNIVPVATRTVAPTAPLRDPNAPIGPQPLAPGQAEGPMNQWNTESQYGTMPAAPEVAPQDVSVVAGMTPPPPQTGTMGAAVAQSQPTAKAPVLLGNPKGRSPGPGLPPFGNGIDVGDVAGELIKGGHYEAARKISAANLAYQKEYLATEKEKYEVYGKQAQQLGSLAGSVVDTPSLYAAIGHAVHDGLIDPQLGQQYIQQGYTTDTIKALEQLKQAGLTAQEQITNRKNDIDQNLRKVEFEDKMRSGSVKSNQDWLDLGSRLFVNGMTAEQFQNGIQSLTGFGAPPEIIAAFTKAGPDGAADLGMTPTQREAASDRKDRQQVMKDSADNMLDLRREGLEMRKSIKAQNGAMTANQMREYTDKKSSYRNHVSELQLAVTPGKDAKGQTVYGSILGKDGVTLTRIQASDLPYWKSRLEEAKTALSDYEKLAPGTTEAPTAAGTKPTGKPAVNVQSLINKYTVGTPKPTTGIPGALFSPKPR